MGVLTLHLVGANVYVPHTDGKKLLAVLPNASRLGTSPTGALDGTPLARHVPFLWEETTDADGNDSVCVPKVFLGARLTFALQGSPTSFDFSAIQTIADQGWLETDSATLKATPDERVSGQILVSAGKAEIFKPTGGACNPAWSRTFSQTINPVVPGLTFLIEGVDSVIATAETWVGEGNKLSYRRSLTANEPVKLYLGNLCAEDVLDWPRNSTAGRVHDNDFKWVYGLSKNAGLNTWIQGGLPVPIVRGSAIHDTDKPSVAFKTFWGGGGGAGCECDGLIDKPQNF